MVWGMWNSSYLRPAVGFEDAAWTTPVHGAVWFASKTFLPENLLEGEINRICEKTIDNMQMQQMWTQRLPSLKLTLRTWKWMLFCRRSDSFGGRPIFSGRGYFPAKLKHHRGLAAFSFSASALQKRMDSLLKLDEAAKSLSHKMGGNRPHDTKLYWMKL